MANEKYEFSNNQDHEAHGICANCHEQIHRFPYGWGHTNTIGLPCRNPIPGRITCCQSHDVAMVVNPVTPKPLDLNDPTLRKLLNLS